MSSHHGSRFTPPPPPRLSSGSAAGRSSGIGGVGAVVGGATGGRPSPVTEADIPAAYNLTDSDDLPTRALHDFVVVRSAASANGPAGALASICELDEPGSSLSASGVLKAPGQPPLRVQLPALNEWCVEHGQAPVLWIHTKRAWYNVTGAPTAEYSRVHAKARRRFEISVRANLLAGALTPPEATYARFISLLGQQYMDMRGHSERDILGETPFILEQARSLEGDQLLLNSAFCKELMRREAAEKKAASRHPASPKRQTSGGGAAVPAASPKVSSLAASDASPTSAAADRAPGTSRFAAKDVKDKFKDKEKDKGARSPPSPVGRASASKPPPPPRVTVPPKTKAPPKSSPKAAPSPPAARPPPLPTALRPPLPKPAPAAAASDKPIVEASHIAKMAAWRSADDKPRWVASPTLTPAARARFLRRADRAVGALFKIRASGPFREPVDPIAHQCPDYPNVVTRPMDLRTVRARYAANSYKEVEELVTDVRQVWFNCHTYNAPGTDLPRMADTADIKFEEALRVADAAEVARDAREAASAAAAAATAANKKRKRSIDGGGSAAKRAAAAATSGSPPVGTAVASGARPPVPPGKSRDKDDTKADAAAKAAANGGGSPKGPRCACGGVAGGCGGAAVAAVGSKYASDACGMALARKRVADMVAAGVDVDAYMREHVEPLVAVPSR
ncbi:hypothetical protein I4F81_002790 [Pyropia yezoensis]|uniref:Uncharacterized protein n=1 Tax=Pyropia yezoensis TaxID=2788 RepID=A0ACC3BR66_PYRYE|nr:hypothetical protein I4F81_002790 [Neopyropia yezoensis]